ncbi:MAG: SLBB domain-containing protein [Candidatus Marinimicrobia bacterium]|nr:SLBB domain-containing protein [Candidatus Neomarinimicrobiota bacterium]
MGKFFKLISIIILSILFSSLLFSQVSRIDFQHNQEIKEENQQTENMLQTNNIINARIAKRKQLEKSIVDLGVLDKIINDSIYVLGPGDILSVNIITAKPIYFETIISPEAKIDIPGMATIDLKDLSLSAGKGKIKKILNEKFINADISVQLVQVKLVKVFLTGAVINPGAISVKASERVVDIILSSGGVDELGKMYSVELIRNDSVSILNGYDYLLRNDLESNPYVQSGDIINVPKADPYTESIMVRGATKKSGVYSIQEDEMLKNFLRRYNNFGNEVDIAKISITREIGKKKKIFNIKLRNTSQKEFILKPGDILEFPMTSEVYVQGFVNVPGAYPFVSGYSAIDYIGLAGGNNENGNTKKVIIFRENGEKLKGFHIKIERGDIIVIPPSLKYSLFDKTGLFGSLATIVLIVSNVVLIMLRSGDI